MYKIEKQFKNINQLIKVFWWLLFIFLCIFTFTELLKYSYCWSIRCTGNFFNHLAGIITKSIPLLAALLATLVADRHITYTSKHRDYDQAFEIQQITHRYIAISKDLRDKINYLKKMFADGGHYIHTFTIIVESIEKRYESLFEKDAYKYLDGKTVDKINSMSANIFGLISSVSILKETPAAKSNQQFLPLPFAPETFDKLIETIDFLLKDLAELKKKTLSEL